MEIIFIRGKKIDLRLLTEHDTKGNYSKWLNDETISKGNNHYRYPVSRNELIDYVASCNNENAITLAIQTKNQVHIGNITLVNIDYVNSSASIAIIIGEQEYWSQGYGHEAMSLLLRHGFKELNLRRISLGTFSNNLAMRRLAKKIGFVEEGKRRKAIYKNGNYLDLIEFGMLKCEFQEVE